MRAISAGLDEFMSCCFMILATPMLSSLAVHTLLCKKRPF